MWMTSAPFPGGHLTFPCNFGHGERDMCTFLRSPPISVMERDICAHFCAPHPHNAPSHFAVESAHTTLLCLSPQQAFSRFVCEPVSSVHLRQAQVHRRQQGALHPPAAKPAHHLSTGHPTNTKKGFSLASDFTFHQHLRAAGVSRVSAEPHSVHTPRPEEPKTERRFSVASNNDPIQALLCASDIQTDFVCCFCFEATSLQFARFGAP